MSVHLVCNKSPSSNKGTTHLHACWAGMHIEINAVGATHPFLGYHPKFKQKGIFGSVVQNLRPTKIGWFSKIYLVKGTNDYHSANCPALHLCASFVDIPPLTNMTRLNASVKCEWMIKRGATYSGLLTSFISLTSLFHLIIHLTLMQFTPIAKLMAATGKKLFK